MCRFFLVDSWVGCFNVDKFFNVRCIGCHFRGRTKMETSGYGMFDKYIIDVDMSHQNENKDQFFEAYITLLI